MLAMQGAIASERALALDERPKRLREGWASRSDVQMARGAWMRRSGDAPERPIRHPLSAIRFLLAGPSTGRRGREQAVLLELEARLLHHGVTVTITRRYRVCAATRTLWLGGRHMVGG